MKTRGAESATLNVERRFSNWRVYLPVGVFSHICMEMNVYISKFRFLVSFPLSSCSACELTGAAFPRVGSMFASLEQQTGRTNSAFPQECDNMLENTAEAAAAENDSRFIYCCCELNNFIASAATLIRHSVPQHPDGCCLHQ